MFGPKTLLFGSLDPLGECDFVGRGPDVSQLIDIAMLAKDRVLHITWSGMTVEASDELMVVGKNMKKHKD